MNKTYHRYTLKKPLPPGAQVREAGGSLMSLLKAGCWHRAPSTGVRSCTPMGRAGGGKNKLKSQQLFHICLLMRYSEDITWDYSKNTTLSEEINQQLHALTCELETVVHVWKLYLLTFVKYVSKNCSKEAPFSTRCSIWLHSPNADVKLYCSFLMQANKQIHNSQKLLKTA